MLGIQRRWLVQTGTVVLGGMRFQDGKSLLPHTDASAATRAELAPLQGRCVCRSQSSFVFCVCG